METMVIGWGRLSVEAWGQKWSFCAIKSCLSSMVVCRNEHSCMPLNLRSVFTKVVHKELPLS